MYTKNEMINIAKKQLSIDYNCELVDFEKKENIISENQLLKGRRLYNSDGCFLKVTCIEGKVMISSDPKMIPWCKEKLLKRDPNWLFDYPKLRLIDKKLNEFGHEITDIHIYYLPNPTDALIEPNYEVKWYERGDILQFSGDERFDEAFAFNSNRPDVLAVAAIEGDKIMGMAGASQDSEDLWQIGINVLPEFVGRGIGTSLVALLKQEIIKRGKVPFYGTGISHMPSQNIAIKAGFFPAWVELYSKAINE